MTKKNPNLHPIQKIAEVLNGVLARSCGHAKFVGQEYQDDYDKNIISHDWSICWDCPTLSDNWVEWDGQRLEWICTHGVGHYDPRMMKPGHGVHGCDGCCSRADSPWKV